MMPRLQPATCPVHGQPWLRILETMLVYQGIEPVEGDPGAFEYSGEYTDFPDTCQPHVTKVKRRGTPVIEQVTVQCDGCCDECTEQVAVLLEGGG